MPGVIVARADVGVDEGSAVSCTLVASCNTILAVIPLTQVEPGRYTLPNTFDEKSRRHCRFNQGWPLHADQLTVAEGNDIGIGDATLFDNLIRRHQKGSDDDELTVLAVCVILREVRIPFGSYGCQIERTSITGYWRDQHRAYWYDWRDLLVLTLLVA